MEMLYVLGKIFGVLGCLITGALTIPCFWMGIDDMLTFHNPDNLGIGIGIAVLIMIGGPSAGLFFWGKGGLNRMDRLNTKDQ